MKRAVLISLFSSRSISREDVDEALRVGRPEELRAGRRGDPLEKGLVDVHVREDPALDDTSRLGVADRDGDLDRAGDGADADRIDADAERLRDARRGVRVDLAGVVAAVRHEDDHLGLRLRRAETGEGVPEGHPDRGPVPLVAERQGGEAVEEHRAVRRQRDDRAGASREDEKAETVARPPLDELADRALGHEEAVARLEVFGRHRARRVEGDEDVDPFRPRLRPLEAEARARETDDQRRPSEERENERDVPESDAPRRARGRRERERRNREGPVSPPFAPDPEEDRERDEEEEEQKLRVAEREPRRNEGAERRERPRHDAFSVPEGAGGGARRASTCSWSLRARTR